MIVCHCKGISDRVVRSAVADGAVTVGEVERACGAGADCGGCRRTLEAVLREASAAPLQTVVVSLTRLQTAH